MLKPKRKERKIVKDTSSEYFDIRMKLRNIIANYYNKLRLAQGEVDTITPGSILCSNLLKQHIFSYLYTMYDIPITTKLVTFIIDEKNGCLRLVLDTDDENIPRQISIKAFTEYLKDHCNEH